MKVYVVVEGGYDWFHVKGVYNDKSDAEEFRKKLDEKIKNHDLEGTAIYTHTLR